MDLAGNRDSWADVPGIVSDLRTAAVRIFVQLWPELKLQGYSDDDLLRIFDVGHERWKRLFDQSFPWSQNEWISFCTSTLGVNDPPTINERFPDWFIQAIKDLRPNYNQYSPGRIIYGDNPKYTLAIASERAVASWVQHPDFMDEVNTQHCRLVGGVAKAGLCGLDATPSQAAIALVNCLVTDCGLSCADASQLEVDEALTMLEKRLNAFDRQKHRKRKKADYKKEQKENSLFNKWQSARESGTYKIDFAKDNGYTPREFQALLNREAKRRARADK